jgi:hypothetical protein
MSKPILIVTDFADLEKLGLDHEGDRKGIW